MKNILLIVLFITASMSAQKLVEIVPDSISDTSNIIEKGLHNVYLDGVIISQHSKYAKAVLKLNNLDKLYPKIDKYIDSPKSEPSGELKIFVDPTKLGIKETLVSGDYKLENFDSEIIKLKGSAKSVIIDSKNIDADVLYILNINNTNVIFDGVSYTSLHITFIKENNIWKFTKN